MRFLVWVALIPWLSAVVRARSTGKALALGFLLSLALGLLIAHWVAHAAHEFLQLSWSTSSLVLLLFAAVFAQPHLVLTAPLVRFTRRRLSERPGGTESLLFAAAAALLYAGLDATVPRFFDAGIGYALHGAPVLRQAADLGGVPLLTFLIVFVNVLGWRIWVALKDTQHRRVIVSSHLAVIALTLGATYLYGTARDRAVDEAVAGAERSLSVAVAQGNVPNEVRLRWAKGDERAAEQQLSTYMLLTEELIGQTPLPDLVVWPEATFPGVFLQPLSTLQRGRANKFDRQVLRLGRPIVFGAYDMEGEDDDRTFYNALFAITPRYDQPGAQGSVQRYHKHVLLPFAESFFSAGPGSGLFEVGMPDGERVGLSPFICSESLSSSHVLRGARRGGEVLLNVGSDGWFGAWGEPQFHLAVSQLRSVETRRSQIRAANTGISAIILPDGEIMVRTELGAETLFRAEVPVVAEMDSLVMRWGSWFGWAALASGILLSLGIGLRPSRPWAESSRGG